MAKKVVYEMKNERRRDKRYKPDDLCSVIIRMIGFPSYQFKVREVSLRGTCFFVKEDSSILNLVQIGDRIDIQYHFNDGSRSSEFHNAEIIHITKVDEELFKGHLYIGVKVLS